MSGGCCVQITLLDSAQKDPSANTCIQDLNCQLHLIKSNKTKANRRL